jgi:UDP-N-acetylmuramoyl-L-alanyl-D-glutamate--2,6-diaminopimelate ligase
MTFQQVLEGAEVLSLRGDPQVKGIAYDSRRVQPGYVFVAMRGESTDGSAFIDAAIAKGAVAIVSDSEVPERTDVAWARVLHGRRALARVAANFYGRPAEKLKITGITGTNGKTTTTFILESIFAAAGRQSALIGTVEYHVAGKIIPAPHTTPEALELQQIFAEALKAGASECVMEVSSHALAQGRVWGVPFDVAIFTNLTRDHLDYHHTFDAYFGAKRILFEGSGTFPPRVAVLNHDDEYGRELLKTSKGKSEIVTYGLEDADFHARNIEITSGGTRFDLVTPEHEIAIWSPLIGRVNVYNILSASAAASARGCTLDEIARGIDQCKRVPGRFETVNGGQPFVLAVDYAHTDDALRNLTSLAREFVSRSKPKGRVITVFGCGGDRDRTKRPLMGEVAGRGSDFVIVTSDNPRSEDPIAIINDAVPGVLKSGVKYALEPDRRKAIAMAIDQARTGDIVLIAGKGHEKTQTTREGVFPFDDVEVARQELLKAGFAHEETPVR